MTISEFRQHILTRLGAPVINIEIAAEQMDIYIRDAIKRFIEVHYDGLDSGVIFLNVVEGEKEYELPANVHSVMEIMSSGTSFSMSIDEPLLVNPYLVGNTYANQGTGYSNFSYLDREMFDQEMAMWRSYSTAGKRAMFQFNQMNGTLKFLADPKESLTVALIVHVSPATFETLYEHEWVQKYSTCLCQIAWAQNIGKYEGATLPGGVQLNFASILAEGKESKEFLETELYERYQEPVDFMFG